MRVMPGPPEDQEDYENLIFFRSWANDGSSLRQVITKKGNKPIILLLFRFAYRETEVRGW